MKRDVLTEESRTVVLRFIEEALNGQSRYCMDELIAEEYVRHMPGGQRITGRDPIGQSAAELGWAACPDWKYEVEALLVSAGGTHTRLVEVGPWRGIPPSSKRYTTTWTAIYRVRDGQIVEQWLDSPELRTTTGDGDALTPWLRPDGGPIRMSTNR
jgi:predicted SnoaL-like aldol condensation-catalyzing enzyme